MPPYIYRMSMMLALLAALSPMAYPAPTTVPSVVTTIKPLHALAANVAGDTLKPALLLHQQQSPHDYRLTPAAAHLLRTSDLVVWVGPGLETQLAIPLQELAPAERRLDLGLRPEMKLLPLRGGGAWEEADEHEDHADADSHLWLDADNAVVILDILQARLGALDPAHAVSYRQNAERAASQIRAADGTIRKLLQVARPRPYWVLHDSLQYFEKRYGLEGAGAIMVNPDRIPGAKRMLELRGQLRSRNIGCILYEERYGRRWIEVLIEDSDVKAIPIDPLGLELEEGPDFYPQLLLNLAVQISKCH